MSNYYQIHYEHFLHPLSLVNHGNVSNLRPSNRNSNSTLLRMPRKFNLFTSNSRAVSQLQVEITTAQPELFSEFYTVQSAIFISPSSAPIALTSIYILQWVLPFCTHCLQPIQPAPFKTCFQNETSVGFVDIFGGFVRERLGHYRLGSSLFMSLLHERLRLGLWRNRPGPPHV